MDTTQEFHPYERDPLPFDPIVIVFDVVRQWFLILAAALIIGMAAYVISDSSYTPVYQTNATLVVTSRSSYASVYDNIDSTSALASVFTEVLNSSILKSKILEDIGLEEFNGTISAKVISETNLLTLQVQGSDPRTVFLVTQAVIENHEIVTYNVIGDIVIEVLQSPTIPTAPVNRSNATEAMTNAMVIAGVMSCLLLALQSYRADTVRSRKEATKKLNCWCLGEIHHERKAKTLADFLRHKKDGILITKPETGFRYVSTISKLCHRIEQHMHGGKVLMVTSVTENEGKSTVAVNLALELARKHRKVLLIDCDLRRPACRKLLELKQIKHSLNEVLTGSVPLDSAIVKEKLFGLYVLPAQKSSPQTAEKLISSDALNQLLQQARQHYSYVVIDLPPMSVATDTEYAMALADSSLLVVRQNQCHAAALNRAIAVLQKGNAKLLGCVLNNVRSTYLSSGESYEAGYGRYGRYDKYGRYNRYAGKHKNESVQ